MGSAENPMTLDEDEGFSKTFRHLKLQNKKN